MSVVNEPLSLSYVKFKWATQIMNEVRAPR